MKNAILFLVFNRPEQTQRVFEEIRKARPPRLYIACDGPRAGKVGELEKVEKVRETVSKIDWPCVVKSLYREKNLGCGIAVSTAITWFFQHEEQGIILEDDCLPSQSFFWYCDELLEVYAEEEKIFIISGYNKQQQWKPLENDYFFSNLGGIWGWATWRRAWKHFNLDMVELDKISKSKYFIDIMGRKLGKRRFKELVQAKNLIEEGKIDSWAYPWGLSRHLKNGLACVPSVSLIENIGFGTDSTHSKTKYLKPIVALELTKPLKMNLEIVPDRAYDLKFIGGLNWQLMLQGIVSYFKNK
jgi:hypothetical protein